MPALLHDPELLHAKLDSLRKSGGKAEDAAEHAWRIIRELAGRRQLTRWLKSKKTPKGEARIDKAGKFDLGNGYRLIFVHKQDCFIFLFLGSHDECYTWISNHRGLKPNPDRCELVSPPEEEAPPTNPEPKREAIEPDEDTERPLHEIYDQETLREIFPGICGYREDPDPS